MRSEYCDDANIEISAGRLFAPYTGVPLCSWTAIICVVLGVFFMCFSREDHLRWAVDLHSINVFGAESLTDAVVKLSVSAMIGGVFDLSRDYKNLLILVVIGHA